MHNFEDDETPSDLRTRVRVAEERLRHGAKSFDSMRRILWFVVVTALGGVGTAAYLVFSTGRFVEQSEATRDAQRATQQQLEVVRGDVRNLDTEQKLMKVDIGLIKGATHRIEQKLEAAPAEGLVQRSRR
jgi:hypothetical protein